MRLCHIECSEELDAASSESLFFGRENGQAWRVMSRPYEPGTAMEIALSLTGEYVDIPLHVADMEAINPQLRVVGMTEPAIKAKDVYTRLMLLAMSASTAFTTVNMHNGIEELVLITAKRRKPEGLYYYYGLAARTTKKD